MPGMPQYHGTHIRLTSLQCASTERASRHSSTSHSVSFKLIRTLSVAWLWEKIGFSNVYKHFFYFHKQAEYFRNKGLSVMIYMQQVLESSLTGTKCTHGKIQKGKLRKLLLIRKRSVSSGCTVATRYVVRGTVLSVMKESLIAGERNIQRAFCTQVSVGCLCCLLTNHRYVISVHTHHLALFTVRHCSLVSRGLVGALYPFINSNLYQNWHFETQVP